MRLDIASCTELPVTLVFLPAHDIASYVGEGNLDLGITGSDIVFETSMENEVEVVTELGFGKCKLCVLTRNDSEYQDVASLAGKRIVTSFPKLSRDFFKQYENGNSTSIKYVSGSVETACSLGLADAVVDLVETGTTMRAAGLHVRYYHGFFFSSFLYTEVVYIQYNPILERFSPQSSPSLRVLIFLSLCGIYQVIGDICTTESVLITRKGWFQVDLVKKVISRIEGYCTAMKYSMICYNVHKDNLESVLAITPAKQSATITPLNDAGWCAVQAVILKTKQGEIMDKLQELGAVSILIFNIANSRM